MDEEKTPQELFNSDEYYYSWWGAMLLAKKIKAHIENHKPNDILGKPKYIYSMLDFLLKSKSDMLNFIFNDDVTIMCSPIKDKKGKIKEYKPYRIIWAGIPKNVAEKLEFISPEENKWRDTARILINVLDNACAALSIFSGKDKNEIFNTLLNGNVIDRPPNGGCLHKSTDKIYCGNVKTEIIDAPAPKLPQPAIILDFYSGSATTAHATMQLNTEDRGERKFIMVQLPEPCKADSEAYKAGYKNICEIGKERIRRAAKKIAKENPNAKFDGGFKVYKIADKKTGKRYVPSDGIISTEAVLQTFIKKSGLPADSVVTEKIIADARFWIIGDNDAVIADSPGTTMEQAEQIVKLNPKYIGLINAAEDVITFIKKYLDKHEKLKVSNHEGDVDNA